MRHESTELATGLSIAFGLATFLFGGVVFVIGVAAFGWRGYQMKRHPERYAEPEPEPPKPRGRPRKEAAPKRKRKRATLA